MIVQRELAKVFFNERLIIKGKAGGRIIQAFLE